MVQLCLSDLNRTVFLVEKVRMEGVPQGRNVLEEEGSGGFDCLLCDRKQVDELRYNSVLLSL